MKVIMKGNIDVHGNRISWCDYHQILERLPYKTSRESLMCSVRILRTQGWIERDGKHVRDGRARQTIAPTEMAKRILDPARVSKPASYKEIVEDDIVVLELD